MTSHVAPLRGLLPVALGLLMVGPGCGVFGSSSPAAPALPPGATLAAEPFSGELAWAHLRALSELGPRPSGSAASQEAYEYIRSRLEALEIEVLELELEAAAVAATKKSSGDESAEAAEGEPDAPKGPEPVVARHLVARIPGASPDSILLVAHYDTRVGSPGANDGASGAAVLLELASQLSQRPLHYTTEVVFLDAEMATTDEAPEMPMLQGSWLFTDHLRQAGTFDVIRLVVVFRQVGDAELTIGRDLHSHRIHRETFFDTAADLGMGHAFPKDRGYVEVVSSHRPLVQSGMPRVVSILDPWYGGDEPPGEHWGGEADTAEHCSPESLYTVGVVSLGSLRRIAARLEKVDMLSGRAERRRMEELALPEITGEAVEEEAPEAPPAAEGEPPAEGSETAAPAAAGEAGPASDAPAAEPTGPAPPEAPEAVPESS